MNKVANKVKRQFTAVYKKDKKWYLGWIEEIPGVNTQGRTKKEVKENLKDALLLILETNKFLNSSGRKAKKIVREPLTVSL